MSGKIEDRIRKWVEFHFEQRKRHLEVVELGVRCNALHTNAEI